MSMLRSVAIDVCRIDEGQIRDLGLSQQHETLATDIRMESPDIDNRLNSPGKRRKESKDTESEHSEITKNDTLKKSEKKRQTNESEEPKPRIVITFRTEKPGLKSSNMKIVSTEEKHDEVSPRRSTRARGGDSDTHDEESHERSLSAMKAIGQSESDEAASDGATTTTLKRSTRRRSKEFSDNVLANAIARKEKSYNETTPSQGTTRLSRRIKPTAKILANKELRIGLETQNNVRLGIVNTNEKSDDAGIQTRRSARRKSVEYSLSDERLMSIDSATPRRLHTKRQHHSSAEEDAKEVGEDNDLHRLNKLKKKHLGKLGLKEVDAQGQEIEMMVNLSAENINDESIMDSSNIEVNVEQLNAASSRADVANSVMDENDLEEVIEEEEESVDEELMYQSQFSSDFSEDEYVGQVEVPTKATRRSPRKNQLDHLRNATRSPSHDAQKCRFSDFYREQSRRSRRQFSSDHIEEDVMSESSNVENSDEESDENADLRTRSSRKKGHKSAELDDEGGDQNRDAPRRSLRKKTRTHYESDEYEALVPTAMEHREPASGDEGSEAACPEDDTRVVATCYCETVTNVYVTPSDLIEPVFCRAVETVDGVRVGCSHGVMREADGSYSSLRRSGPRAPYFLSCRLHARQLANHMCCPACGMFCTQGTFYQCSKGHLFHLECGLPYGGMKMPPGCPHCGLFSYRWQPCNRNCLKVKVEMKCSNKRIFLPEQREQCTPAYFGFSKLDAEKLGQEPIIPEDLLPCSPIDLKRLCSRSENTDYEELLSSSPSERLYDAIVQMVKAEELIPKIMSGVDVNKGLDDVEGGTYMHLAARCGNLTAAYLLHYAGANLNITDCTQRTPLMLAVLALLDKTEKTTDKTEKKPNKKKDGKELRSVEKKVDERKDKMTKDSKEQAGDSKKKNNDKDQVNNDEGLLKVIRYLVAAGCDVNLPGPDGMTALHMSAQHGGVTACGVLLGAHDTHVDPRDHGGWSPLVWAAEHGHVQVVRLLLSYGADAAAMDSEGNAALHWCALAGHATSLALLLDAAPAHALDALNAHGDTPLHVAARQGHYSCVVILLARGARTDIENTSGELAVEVCSGQCQASISLNMQVTLAAREHGKPQRLLSSDISNGRELYPVPCVNDVDDEPLPVFTYVTQHVFPQQIHVDNTLATLQGCSCSEADCGASTCACGVLGVRRWYARGRLVPTFPYHEPPMLFECNHTCACAPNLCSNAVVTRACALGSRSLLVRAQVFRGRGARGWGLRAGGVVLRGAPVAVYCGELLTVQAADSRPRDQYMFSLDLKTDLLEQCEDKSQLCVDAGSFGSAARFINHSCRPNLAPVRVFTGTRDLRRPDIVLFATRDIPHMEEFTFDYGDKFWSVKSKWMHCECGALDCRYPTKTSEEEAENI